MGFSRRTLKKVAKLLKSLTTDISVSENANNKRDCLLRSRQQFWLTSETPVTRLLTVSPCQFFSPQFTCNFDGIVTICGRARSVSSWGLRHTRALVDSTKLKVEMGRHLGLEPKNARNFRPWHAVSSFSSLLTLPLPFCHRKRSTPLERKKTTIENFKAESVFWIFFSICREIWKYDCVNRLMKIWHSAMANKLA